MSLLDSSPATGSGHLQQKTYGEIYPDSDPSWVSSWHYFCLCLIRLSTFWHISIRYQCIVQSFNIRMIQFNSVSQLCPVFCHPMDCSMPGFPVHHQLPELAQTHVHRVSNAIQPSHPLLSPSPPSLNLSQHQGLFNVSVLNIRWSKYWSFTFSISPSNEYSGLISFRMDWLDILAVQGAIKSLLQQDSSKA